VQPERLQLELREGEPRQAAQLQPDGRDGVRRADGRAEPVRGEPLRRRDGDRPEGGVVAGAEAARHAADRARVQGRVARDARARGELAERGVEVELDQRHRRQRPQVVRVEDVEQRLADLRELVVELEVHARGEEGEALQHPLHVRVLGLAGLQQQAAGDLRVLLGELGAHAPEVRQLALVVVEQLVTHDRLRTRRTRRW
jgi:hypothetical protein